MPTSRSFLSRIIFGLVTLFGVVLAGTLGYHWLEGWTMGESAYVTLLIVSTLGFGRLAPLTGGGQALTSLLIIVGVGTLFYLLSNAAEQFIETSLGLTQARRMERMIAKMRGHHIICGYGRVGRHAAQELADENQPFVVVDSDPTMVDQARANGCASILGDATTDQTLRLAGIERAGGLLITTASDAANVFITLSARIYNKDIVIIARANDDTSQAKLERAGADKIVAPESIGGKHMASLLIRPGAAEAIDTLLHAEDQDNWLEQTVIAANSPFCGKALEEMQLEQRTGVRIIAIRRTDGTLIANPQAAEVLQDDDIVVTIGERSQLQQLEQLIKSADLNHVRTEG